MRIDSHVEIYIDIDIYIYTHINQHMDRGIGFRGINGLVLLGKICMKPIVCPVRYGSFLPMVSLQKFNKKKMLKF